MLVRAEVNQLLQDNHHSEEQFPALCGVFARVQLVRDLFKLHSQKLEPLIIRCHESCHIMILGAHAIRCLRYVESTVGLPLQQLLPSRLARSEFNWPAVQSGSFADAWHGTKPEKAALFFRSSFGVS